MKAELLVNSYLEGVLYEIFLLESLTNYL